MTDADHARHEDEELRRAMERLRGRAQEPVAAASGAEAPSSDEPPARGLRARVRADLARVPTPDAAAWPPAVAGLVAGLWAAAMSLLILAGVLLVGWVFAPLGSGELSDVARASGALWLLSNGGEVHWQHAVLSLPPLYLTLVIVLLQRRAGAWLANAVASSRASDAAQGLGFAVAAAMSAQALVAASIANASLSVALPRSLAGSLLVALAGFGWGMAREVGITWPEPLRDGVRVLRDLGLALSALAAIVVLAAAVAQRHAFAGVLAAIAGDTTSKLQVLLLTLAYLPTLLGWALALFLGPGFSLGAGTSVAWGGVTLGALPPLPPLALVPSQLPAGTRVLLLLPALLACWAVGSIVREPDWRRLGLLAVLAVLAGWLAAAMCAGGIGPGRLTLVGPAPWALALALLGWLALGVGVRLGLRWALSRWRQARVTRAQAAGRLPA